MASHQFLQKNRRQGGYTIVELGIALTIVAVLIIAGLAGVTSVLNTSKANDQISASGQVIAKLQSFVTNTRATDGLNTASGIGMGLFPPQRLNTARTAVANVFAGAEFVETNGFAIAATATTQAIPVNTSVIYTLTNVPRAVCADIAITLANLSDTAWVGNLIVGAPGAAPAVPVKTSGVATDIATVGTQCNTGDLVGMSFLLRP